MIFMWGAFALCSVTVNAALQPTGIIVASGNANQSFLTDDKDNLSWDFNSKQLSVNGTISTVTMNITGGLSVYPSIIEKTGNFTYSSPALAKCMSITAKVIE